MTSPTPTVALKLTESEAIVLFEFLSRFSDRERLEVEDSAETKVLRNLLCLLEKELTAPLKADYQVILAKARSELRDESQ